MTLHYLKFSPTGNITLLVTTPVSRADQPGVASRLLDAVGGEQVGFLEPPADPRSPARLQMMGGEFCGNATMSLGALLARGLGDGDSLDLSIEVSGLTAPCPCRITREGAGWTGTVDMPLPMHVTQAPLDTDAGPLTVPLVALPGISHLILPASAAPGEAELRRRLPRWNEVIGADALGALAWDAAARSIDPLVYVPSAGTLVREHGCGSGTAAVGCWLALSLGRDVEAPIAQPGGAITVRAALSGHQITALSITGHIALLEEADAEL